MEYQIFAIGDSITYGKKDKLGGWVDRLKIKLLEIGSKTPDFSVILYNLGISGDITDSLISRFEKEILVRQKFYPNRKSIVLMAFGANDAGFSQQKFGYKVSKEDFKTNLLKGVNLSKENQIQPILINITPVIDSIENQADNYGNLRSNEFISEFNEILEEISHSQKCLLVDINSKFINSQENLEDLFDGDGLHPNTKGHELIYETILEFLEEKVLV